MNCFAGLSLLHSQEQFLLKNPIVDELVLGNMDDHNADLEFG